MDDNDKLRAVSTLDSEAESLHQQACERELESYTDPKTGYLVFTALYHKRRGYCCQSGCRHCPYGFRKERA